MNPWIHLLLIWLAGTSNPDGVEVWRPVDHPAWLDRTLSGFTRPSRTLQISSEVSARVVTVVPDEGDVVRGPVGESAPVIVLEDGLARSDLAASEAEVRSTGARLEVLAASLRLAGSEVDYRSRAFERIEKLAADGRASEEELDDSRYRRDAARLRVAELESEVRVAEATRDRARSGEARSRELLARHTIAAPTGWVVERRFAEPGELAAAGSVLLDLVSVEQLLIPLPMTSSELAAVRQLRPLVVELGIEGRSVAAKIHFVSVEFDPASQKRRVELSVSGRDCMEAVGEAAGGIEARLRLQVPDRSGAVMVPKRFVERRLEQSIVRTQAGESYAVTLLRTEGEMYAILPGDLPRDAVLVPPAQDR